MDFSYTQLYYLELNENYNQVVWELLEYLKINLSSFDDKGFDR